MTEPTAGPKTQEDTKENVEEDGVPSPENTPLQ